MLADLALRAAAARRGLHAQAEGDVLEHRHVPEQRVVLEHEADLALARVRRRSRPRRANRTLPASGVFEARDDAQQRGLAAARRPEQRDQLARRDVERRRRRARVKSPKRLLMLRTSMLMISRLQLDARGAATVAPALPPFDAAT